jgi:hypothetical protein
MIIQIEQRWTEKIKGILKSKEQIINEISSDLFEILNRGLLYPKEFSKERILFLGINPSFRAKYDDPFGFNQITFEEEIHKISEDKRYVYFKVFETICKNLPWTHFDILPFRERNQKMITQFFHNGPNEIQQILMEFLDISKKLIEESRPKVIVVSNAFVRNLFSFGIEKIENINYQIFKTSFSEELGTHYITEGALINTPVLFTSMLSGQRAMDVGSRERLEWHIRKLYANH